VRQFPAGAVTHARLLCADRLAARQRFSSQVDPGEILPLREVPPAGRVATDNAALHMNLMTVNSGMLEKKCLSDKVLTSIGRAG
jgi:hypothetical protein